MFRCQSFILAFVCNVMKCQFGGLTGICIFSLSSVLGPVTVADCHCEAVSQETDRHARASAAGAHVGNTG